MKSICVYKLRQQTPILHFQYDESGACLRGSEVKSKLDKFLNHIAPQKIRGDWLIDAEKSKALNYKVRIMPKEEAEIVPIERGLYFGATKELWEKNDGQKLPIPAKSVKKMGTGQEKLAVFYHEDIELKIICFIPELVKLIDEYIEVFFLLHNFGTRQKKGYGSFIVEGKHDNPDALLAEYTGENKRIYKIQYDNGTKYSDIFKDITGFSNVLKSGYNQKDNYLKSYLVKHCLDETKHNGIRIGGEKRWLKAEVKMAPTIKRESTVETPHGSVNQYYYTRALLGAHGQLKFATRLNDREIPDRAGAVNIQIKGKGGVERIPAPVLYKIVGNALYIIVESHSKAVYGKTFVFKTKEQMKSLQVPARQDVDIQLVFADYVAEINDRQSEYYYTMKNAMRLKFLKQDKRIETIGKGVK